MQAVLVVEGDQVLNQPPDPAVDVDAVAGAAVGVGHDVLHQRERAAAGDEDAVAGVVVGADVFEGQAGGAAGCVDGVVTADKLQVPDGHEVRINEQARDKDCRCRLNCRRLNCRLIRWQ